MQSHKNAQTLTGVKSTGIPPAGAGSDGRVDEPQCAKHNHREGIQFLQALTNDLTVHFLKSLTNNLTDNVVMVDWLAYVPMCIAFPSQVLTGPLVFS